ncbi:MAG: hypothetical protein ACYCXW_13835, partial [Solirubrobacteraceae bacterium]
MNEVARRVIELRGEGLATTEIAHRLNIAQSTVHHHLRARADLDRIAQETPAAGTRPARPLGATRALVGILLAQGHTRAEISRRLNIGKSTVTYHVRQLGEAVDSRCAARFEWTAIQTYY